MPATLSSIVKSLQVRTGNTFYTAVTDENNIPFSCLLCIEVNGLTGTHYDI
jgi:hypothetical protein